MIGNASLPDSAMTAETQEGRRSLEATTFPMP
jgi:hypothetical protein